jgi:hypothetical protein
MYADRPASVVRSQAEYGPSRLRPIPRRNEPNRYKKATTRGAPVRKRAARGTPSSTRNSASSNGYRLPRSRYAPLFPTAHVPVAWRTVHSSVPRFSWRATRMRAKPAAVPNVTPPATCRR